MKRTAYHFVALGFKFAFANSQAKLATLSNIRAYGTADDVVKDAGLEKELISRFKEVQDLGTDEKKTVLSLMDAYIAKTKIQTILHSK